MNIGRASTLSGLNNKTIRYYEDIGLVIPRRQVSNDYRDYTDGDVEQLRFLQRARAVGFALDECRELLELYRDPARQSGQVKQLVLERLKQLDEQLAVLHTMRVTLAQMAERCAGDETSRCAIIDNLVRSDSSSQKSFSNMPFTLVGSHDD